MWKNKLGPTEPGIGGREFLIYQLVDAFKEISIFAANNSFDWRKQYSQKSWRKLFKLLAKFLKIMCKWILFRASNYTKN